MLEANTKTSRDIDSCLKLTQGFVLRKARSRSLDMVLDLTAVMTVLESLVAVLVNFSQGPLQRVSNVIQSRLAWIVYWAATQMPLLSLLFFADQVNHCRLGSLTGH